MWAVCGAPRGGLGRERRAEVGICRAYVRGHMNTSLCAVPMRGDRLQAEHTGGQCEKEAQGLTRRRQRAFLKHTVEGRSLLPRGGGGAGACCAGSTVLLVEISWHRQVVKLVQDFELFPSQCRDFIHSRYLGSVSAGSGRGSSRRRAGAGQPGSGSCRAAGAGTQQVAGAQLARSRWPARCR